MQTLSMVAMSFWKGEIHNYIISQLNSFSQYLNVVEDFQVSANQNPSVYWKMFSSDLKEMKT